MRERKITLGEMRGAGVTGLLIYCSDYRCSHHLAISADPLILGLTMCAYPIWSLASSARRAAPAAPTFDRTLLRREWVLTRGERNTVVLRNPSLLWRTIGFLLPGLRFHTEQI
jgi:hypothetical protein